jgi:hypothetical protein
MKLFTFIISIIALLDVITILYIVNFTCNEEVKDLSTPMNIFFGIIAGLIIWIIHFQVKEMRSKENHG